MLDRAADIGLLESLGDGHYQIHPALPWYFTMLYTTSYGQPDTPAARRAARAYIRTIGDLGDYYLRQANNGRELQVIPALTMEEANLRHALELGRSHELWNAAVGCLQGLSVLYRRTGRDGEWARLVADVTPDFIDRASGGPLPGREDVWSIVTYYSARIARAARDWDTATTLQKAIIEKNRA